MAGGTCKTLEVSRGVPHKVLGIHLRPEPCSRWIASYTARVEKAVVRDWGHFSPGFQSPKQKIWAQPELPERSHMAGR